MSAKRLLILLAIAAVLLVFIVVRFLIGDGLISIDLDDAPLSKVLSIIEKQGGVKISTNADSATTVTLHVRKAPVVDTLETVATRVDGDLRLAYIAAPDKQKIEAALMDFRTNQNSSGWTAFSTPMMGAMVQSDDNIAADPRIRACSITIESDKSLQAALNQFSQKTGILTALPQDWNPTVTKTSVKGKAQNVAYQLVGSASGTLREIFLISINRRNQNRPQANGQEPPSPIFASRMNRDSINPEWVAERVQAEIAQLPPEQRETAQQQATEMRKMWDTVRNLPPEERRQKMMEMMSSPAMQEQMMDRMAARDARRTPKQRQDRYRRYADRKNKAKNPPAQ